MRSIDKIILTLAALCMGHSQANASAESQSHEVEVTLGIKSPLVGTKSMDKLVVTLPDSTKHEISIRPGDVKQNMRWNLGTISTEDLSKQDLTFYFTNVFHPEDETFSTSCSTKNIHLSMKGKDLVKLRIHIATKPSPRPELDKIQHTCSFEEVFAER